MKKTNHTKALAITLKLAVSSIVLVLSAQSTFAKSKICDVKICADLLRGADLDDSATSAVTKGDNTELEDSKDAPAAGYAISVDGQVVSGSRKIADRQRATDVALEAVDIQVKFDGLDVKPILNISTFPVRRTYLAGEEIDFLISLNYGSWVTKGEVRIYEVGAEGKKPPFAVVAVASNGTAVWHMPAQGPKDFIYVLRVYDEQGRFDETRPLSLARSAKAIAQHETAAPAIAPGYSEDGTSTRNIPVYGGAVTVFGSNVTGQDSVNIMGDSVPVDADGKFVVQRILPPGDHNVSVKIRDKNAKGIEFNRSINIPSSEWFYVGLADLTAGKRFGSNAIQNASPGEFDKIYTKGRLAFYVKGKIKGSTLLTAAADTGEEDFNHLLTGLDGKNPKQFLSRIDPNKYYPVYGDDSTKVEDAPTRGKFYVRLERGDSHVMWGNFKTKITGTKYLRNERALYGASAVYRSPTTLPSGERQTEASVYAAQPGTLAQRDILRGTGGSAYFLKHQDISVGSETVSVIIQDKITNRVLDRRILKYGVDYTVDYIQGLILLTAPLDSTARDGAVVRDGALGGNPVNLVASYEYTPSTTDVKGYAYGGRAQQWLGDHVRLGVTGSQDKTGVADQTMLGADIKVQHSEGTYVEAEIARSEGPGFGYTTSSDGGLTIADIATSGASGRRANAYRTELHADLADFTEGAAKGDLQAYFDHKDGGFSSLEEQVNSTKNDWSVKGNLSVQDNLKIGGSYTSTDVQGDHKEQEIEGHAGIQLGENWTVTPGIKHSSRKVMAATATDNGSRTDVGANLTYKSDDDHLAYVFGQATVARSGNRKLNNRIGIGGETKLSEKVTGTAEVSYGTGGLGGLAKLAYRPTVDDTYYAGYRLESDRNELSSVLYGDDLGSIIAGAKHRYSEQLSIFAEDSYDMFGVRKTLAQTYGVEYTPAARWTLGGNLEIGSIKDDSINATTLLKNSDFDRQALALSAGYKDDAGNTGKIKGEVRLEDSEDNTRNLTSYLFAANIGIRSSEDWRFIGNLDAVFTDATQTTRDGDYVEASLGYAYRPVDNDRLNALFKYTFLYDLPGADQVTVNGSTLGPAQQSHILSADVNYDLSEIITVGAKYGFRIGQTKPRNGSADWSTSSAHLGVLRADLNIVKDWDALVEGRILWTPETGNSDFGALAAVYRHFGDNFKMGVGYNFGRFSDDLRDQSYDSHGIFINAIGKF